MRLSSRCCPRVRILQLLAEKGGISVDEFNAQLSATLTTVSRHLQLLRMHGLVLQEAQNRFYSLNRRYIAQQISLFLDDLAIELPEKTRLGTG